MIVWRSQTPSFENDCADEKIRLFKTNSTPSWPSSLPPRRPAPETAAYGLIEGLVATVVPQIKPAIQCLFLVDG